MFSLLGLEVSFDDLGDLNVDVHNILKEHVEHIALVLVVLFLQLAEIHLFLVALLLLEGSVQLHCLLF